MPPLVRKGSLWQRLKTNLDPLEIALSISEELNDDRLINLLNKAAAPLAIALNIVFILLKQYDTRQEDDVFGDTRNNRVLTILHTIVLHGLAVLCCANAAFAYFDKKQYQLLYQPIDQPPATPSARRVLLDTGNGKEEVWQVDIWHPKELSLTFFTFFSPVHVILYYLVLPSTRAHALLVGLLGVIMSLQAAAIQARFSRQAQDTRILHGQVLHEYNTNFVQPLMHRPVRDVGVQATAQGRWTVDAYTPGLLLNRGTGHLNHTPTSYTSEHGLNTPRSQLNGCTPTQNGHPSAMSVLKQRHGRPGSENITPTARYSNSRNYSSPAVANNPNHIDESDGDEIRVAWKPSPPQNKLDRRRSYRPGR